jgi:HD-like signal output (HDOD) protein
MERIVSCDPALAVKMLRIANSAYYGFKSEVTTVKQAVVLLGLMTVRSLVVGASCYDVFARAGAPDDREALWLHSIGTAVAAEGLAKSVRGVVPEEAYLAGLLHDVGVAVIAMSYPEVPRLVAAQSLDGEVSRREAEVDLLGCDHAQMGMLVAQEWGLPAPIAGAIGYHHSPAGAAVAPELAACTHVSDLVASRVGFALDSLAKAGEPEPYALSVLGLSAGDVDEACWEMEACLEEIRAMASQIGGGHAISGEAGAETAVLDAAG